MIVKTIEEHNLWKSDNLPGIIESSGSIVYQFAYIFL